MIEPLPLLYVQHADYTTLRLPSGLGARVSQFVIPADDLLGQRTERRHRARTPLLVSKTEGWMRVVH